MENDLSKVTTATNWSLKNISLMSSLLEIFQKCNKTSFQYKKHLWEVSFWNLQIHTGTSAGWM